MKKFASAFQNKKKFSIINPKHSKKGAFCPLTRSPKSLCVFIHLRRKYISPPLFRDVVAGEKGPLSLSLSGPVWICFCAFEVEAFLFFKGKALTRASFRVEEYLSHRRSERLSYYASGTRVKHTNLNEKTARTIHSIFLRLNSRRRRRNTNHHTRHTRATTTTTRCDASPPGFWWFRAKG